MTTARAKRSEQRHLMKEYKSYQDSVKFWENVEAKAKAENIPAMQRRAAEKVKDFQQKVELLRTNLFGRRH